MVSAESSFEHQEEYGSCKAEVKPLPLTGAEVKNKHNFYSHSLRAANHRTVRPPDTMGLSAFEQVYGLMKSCRCGGDLPLTALEGLNFDTGSPKQRGNEHLRRSDTERAITLSEVRGQAVTPCKRKSQSSWGGGDHTLGQWRCTIKSLKVTEPV